MTGHGNYYAVDGRRSVKNRWPDADTVAAVGGSVCECKTDRRVDLEDIKQHFARRERIGLDEDRAQDGGIDD